MDKSGFTKVVVLDAESGLQAIGQDKREPIVDWGNDWPHETWLEAMEQRKQNATEQFNSRSTWGPE